MKDVQKFVGLVASKDTIAVAIADPGRGEPRFHSTIQNKPENIRKLMKSLGDPENLFVCYEAGSSGYGIYRLLLSMDIECIVVAPTLIPKRSGDRVKTDKRDAIRLAQLLRAAELTSVWVPDEDHEALRDLIRARHDAPVRIYKVLVRDLFISYFVMKYVPRKGFEIGLSNILNG
ncbi:transposase [Paenibacillus solisilvae]|uniref:Transposase n=1 Tax=Paenibacillus solisilvae TaxID=2486751 RepID=A0ABW0W2N5_9BACL